MDRFEESLLKLLETLNQTIIENQTQESNSEVWISVEAGMIGIVLGFLLNLGQQLIQKTLKMNKNRNAVLEQITMHQNLMSQDSRSVVDFESINLEPSVLMSMELQEEFRSNCFKYFTRARTMYLQLLHVETRISLETRDLFRESLREEQRHILAQNVQPLADLFGMVKSNK